MSLPEVLLIAGALLVLATLVGLLLRRREGRRVAARAEERVRVSDIEGDFGEAATLVQFSTEFCTRCPQLARQLGGLAEHYWGLRHVEVDLTHRADLARHYRVLQTPTTLLVDKVGLVRARYLGIPDTATLTEDLAELTTPEGAQL